MRPGRLTVLILLCSCPDKETATDTATDTGTTSTTATTSTTDTATGSETQSSTTLAPTSTSSGAPTTADTGSGTSGTTAGLGCAPVPDATEDCCCFSVDNLVYANACPETPLCPDVQIRCSFFDGSCPVGSGGEPGEWTVNDPAALECVLAALRDGTPGKLSWSFATAEVGGQWSIEVTQHIQPDRSVFSLIYEREDLAFFRRDLTREALAPSSTFTACLDIPDLKTRSLCLADTTSGPVLDLCIPGG